MGKIGGFVAREHFKKEGYFILQQNYRNKYGEIVIISKKDKCLIFTEVKARTGLKYGSPLESINASKVSRIRKAANFYIACSDNSELNPRFDIITIIIKKILIKKISGEDNIFGKKFKLNTLENKSYIEVEHIKNAF